MVNASWIDPKRIALLRVAGTVEPLQYLCAERRAVWQDMQRLKTCAHEWETAPVGFLRVRPHDERKLAERLLESQMCVLVDVSLLPRTPSGRLLVSGMFAVPKDVDADRLIIDRRPPNHIEKRLNWLHLPSPHQLRQLVLGPHEILRGSGEDLNILLCPRSHRRMDPSECRRPPRHGSPRPKAWWGPLA